MERTDNGNRVKFMQYLNTAILTIIMFVSGILSVQMAKMTNNQQQFSNEMVRMKTVQEINTKSLEALSGRVTTLELNYLDYIKTWIEQNYMRKPQAK